MKNATTIRTSIAGICFVLIACVSAYSQTSTAEETKTEIPEGAGQVQAFYDLTKIAPKALAEGEYESARRNAEELLIEAEYHRDDWNYGNAIHVANLVLGFIALDSDNIEEAKQFLLKAGDTPGSPQLDNFGPNMLLAKELLEKGEYETVLKYFEKCGLFWKMHNDRLENWKDTVKNKQVPDFGANLIYQLGGSVSDSRNAKQNLGD